MIYRRARVCLGSASPKFKEIKQKKGSLGLWLSVPSLKGSSSLWARCRITSCSSHSLSQPLPADRERIFCVSKTVKQAAAIPLCVIFSCDAYEIWKKEHQLHTCTQLYLVVIFSTSSALQLPYTEPLLVFICNSYSFPATSSLGRCIQSQGCVYSFLTRTHFWISSGYFSWHHLLLLEGFPMEMFSNLLCLLVIEQFYVPYLAKLCVSFYENSSCTIKMSFLQRKERVE